VRWLGALCNTATGCAGLPGWCFLRHGGGGGVRVAEGDGVGWQLVRAVGLRVVRSEAQRVASWIPRPSATQSQSAVSDRTRRDAEGGREGQSALLLCKQRLPASLQLTLRTHRWFVSPMPNDRESTSLSSRRSTHRLLTSPARRVLIRDGMPLLVESAVLSNALLRALLPCASV
jgi:hypothetical protein